MILELISLLPLVGPTFTDPLAVKLLDNRLYILEISKVAIVSYLIWVFLDEFFDSFDGNRSGSF